MTKTVEVVTSQDPLPVSTTVAIIGGGIVGVSAALTLAERNIPVVLLEKGPIAAEQSSRNLGWIRKTSRHLEDIPLARAADKLWADMPNRIGRDVGYQQAGILFLARTEAEMVVHENWLKSVAGLALDSRLISPREIDQLVPGGNGDWVGGIYTPSDGRAEPAIAAPSMARAAIKKGAVIIQNCAAHSLLTEGGKVSGLVTEKGEIRCDQVLLTSGMWSRRFLGNHGISLPVLPVIASVLRTKPMTGPTDIAVGGPDFSFRKHPDGGFIIMQRGKVDAPITLDHLLIGHRFFRQLMAQGSALNISFGRHFFKDLALHRRWSAKSRSPFEKIRTLNPQANGDLLQDALNNLGRAWSVFKQAEIEEAWAGTIDATPDSNPVIDRIDKIPGLSVATGFSGHGFGTGPAAGQLAADLVSNTEPIIDPRPYRFGRF